MSNPTGKGGPVAGGPSRNPSGFSASERAERERVNALLLTPERDEKWLASYDKALEDGIAPIILDYAYRRLGKPKESVEVSGNISNTPNFPDMTPEERTEYLDALAIVLKGKS